MQCCTELVPPTSVSHAVSLSFISPKAHNLVVAKQSLLQLFEYRSTVTEVGRGTKGSAVNGLAEEDDVSVQRTENTTKLVLIGEYPVSGTVISLARIKALNTKSGGEALIVAFRDAKLSLIEWDPQSYSIHTISLHYYEGEDLAAAPWSVNRNQCQNILTVDPSNRCAALKFGSRQLAILPFRQLGDDLVEGDYDPDLDEPMNGTDDLKKPTAGNVDTNQTPYSSSFVLPLTVLDPALTHPVHLSFLHEYREPTFGVINAASTASKALLPVRKDVLNYSVFTLDLDQRASTTLLSVSGLPNDLSRVIALPMPVGGALLIGDNEMIHVDQAGKTNAVAVNEFAKQSSAFPMADQSSLALKLEGCVVEQLSSDNGDMLIILDTGSLAILSFKIDGRTVSGLAIHIVSPEKGGLTLLTMGSCAANTGRNRIFVGSEQGDSVLLGWSRRNVQLTRKRSHAEMLSDDADFSFDDEEDLDDHDDDLYGSTDPSSRTNGTNGISTEPHDYSFRAHDSLPNFGPIRDAAVGRSLTSVAKRSPEPDATSLPEIVTASGDGKAATVNVFCKEINPLVLAQPKLVGARAIWSVHAKKPSPKGLELEGALDSEATLAADSQLDEFILVSRALDGGGEQSAIYKINGNTIEEAEASEFEADAGATISAGTLANGTRIVQILKNEIRSYDSELGLAQITPLEDEETGKEHQVVGVSFADPYLLVLREDTSIVIFKADDRGELEQIDLGEEIASAKWQCACLYKGRSSPKEPLIFLLSKEGSLQIFELPHPADPVCFAEGLTYLPSHLSSSFVPRRGASKAVLIEMIAGDLGDEIHKSLHLVFRTATEDLVAYRPYHTLYSQQDSNAPFKFTANLHWRKSFQPRIATTLEDVSAPTDALRRSRLHACANIGGYSTVFKSGASPCFMIKSASSPLRIIPLRETKIDGFTSFHTERCDRGFACSSGTAEIKICQIDKAFQYGTTGWATRRIALEENVEAVCYYPTGQLYVIATSTKAPFQAPTDEHIHSGVASAWQEEEIALPPKVDRGKINLLNPYNWSVIDSHPLDPSEVVLCMKSVKLEVSEKTHQQKHIIAVGTSLIHGEVLPARGRIYLIEVVEVVPETDRPWTNYKLKLLAKEEVRGAVTALSGVGLEGFLAVAHGQKLLLRGMREDGLVPPIAFLDTPLYTTSLKGLKGTNFMVVGDILKGFWFTGYTALPYRMHLFSKSKMKMEVINVDFLPVRDQLYIVAVDAEENIHVVQFDPEHPESLSGQRLIPKSTFHLGHFPSQLILLPGNPSATTSDQTALTNEDAMALDDDAEEGHRVASSSLARLLLTTQSGSISVITPVFESTYRRLSILQAYLLNQLDHACGLNPRSHRMVDGDGMSSRSMLDGTLLRRWCELPSFRMAEACSKIGVEEWVIRADLELISDDGLAYI